MALDQQLFMGAACLGIIAIVVVVNTKTPSEEIAEGGGDDPDDQFSQVEQIRLRWEAIGGLPNLDGDVVRDIIRDINALRERDTTRTDALKNSLDEIVSEIENATSRTAATGVTVETIVPQNPEVAPVTDAPRVGGDFDQQAGGAEKPPGSFRQTPEEYDEMVHDYADREKSGVPTTSDKDQAAFSTQPDPLNARENSPDGSAQIAEDEVQGGFVNNPPPLEVVDSNLAPAGVATSFNTVEDPPSVPDPPLPPPKKPLARPAEEVLAADKDIAAKKQADEDKNFTTSDDSEIAALKVALSREKDPLQKAELEDRIIDLTGGASDDDDPRTTKFVNTLTGHATTIAKNRAKLDSGYDLRTFNAYNAALKLVKELYNDAPNADCKQRAKTVYQNSYKWLSDKKKTWGIKSKNKRSNPGTTNPKRRKTSDAGALARFGEQGRPPSGEPPAKKAQTGNKQGNEPDFSQ